MRNPYCRSRQHPAEWMDRKAGSRALAARTAGGVVAVMMLSAPAIAQTSAVDAFAVKLASPYKVAPSSHPINDSTFAITTSAEKPRPSSSDKVLCKAGFKLAPQNAKLSQAQINSFVGSDQWRQGSRATISRGFKIESDAGFNDKGVAGHEFVAVPLQGPDASRTRVYLTIAETPAGRTSMSCATFVEDFAAALPAFRAIRAAITMPR
jgi:hypothetical protein